MVGVREVVRGRAPMVAMAVRFDRAPGVVARMAVDRLPVPVVLVRVGPAHVLHGAVVAFVVVRRQVVVQRDVQTRAELEADEPGGESRPDQQPPASCPAHAHG
jgi:hypothetical protein